MLIALPVVSAMTHSHHWVLNGHECMCVAVLVCVYACVCMLGCAACVCDEMFYASISAKRLTEKWDFFFFSMR